MMSNGILPSIVTCVLLGQFPISCADNPKAGTAGPATKKKDDGSKKVATKGEEQRKQEQAAGPIVEATSAPSSKGVLTPGFADQFGGKCGQTHESGIQLTGVDDRIAIVIGVSNYDGSPLGLKTLDTSVVNIDPICSSLVNRGFIVVGGYYEGSSAGLLTEIKHLIASLGETARVFFHFSGHGAEVLLDNQLRQYLYFTPQRGMRLNAEDDRLYLGDLVATIEGARTNKTIPLALSIDACRNNAGPIKNPSLPEVGPGTAMIFAASSGERSYENSFVERLSSALVNEPLDVFEALSKMGRDLVETAPNFRQVPVFLQSLGGIRFPFGPREQRESEAWRKVDKSNDDGLANFIRAFPTSSFVPLARNFRLELADKNNKLSKELKDLLAPFQPQDMTLVRKLRDTVQWSESPKARFQLSQILLQISGKTNVESADQRLEAREVLALARAQGDVAADFALNWMDVSVELSRATTAKPWGVTAQRVCSELPAPGTAAEKAYEASRATFLIPISELRTQCAISSLIESLAQSTRKDGYLSEETCRQVAKEISVAAVGLLRKLGCEMGNKSKE